MSATVNVCWEGCTWSLWGVPDPRWVYLVGGCTWSWRGVPGPRVVYLDPDGGTWTQEGGTWSQRVYLVPGGVPGPRGCTCLVPLGLPGPVLPP